MNKALIPFDGPHGVKLLSEKTGEPGLKRDLDKFGVRVSILELRSLQRSEVLSEFNVADSGGGFIYLTSDESSKTFILVAKATGHFCDSKPIILLDQESLLEA